MHFTVQSFFLAFTVVEGLRHAVLESCIMHLPVYFLTLLMHLAMEFPTFTVQLPVNFIALTIETIFDSVAFAVQMLSPLLFAMPRGLV